MMARLKFLRVPLFIAFAVLVGAAVTIACHPEWVRIDAVRVELKETSREYLLYQRIRTALEPQFTHFAGLYFWQVPLERVFEATAGDKRVKTVSVYREFPGRLRVVIEPYTPVLAYLAGDGRIYPVATDATLLPALSATDTPDLPLLRGEDLKDEPDLRERAIDLYRDVPEDGVFTKRKISEIVYTKKDGFKLFVAGSSTEVRIGDTDFGPKVSRVQKVLSYLDSQNIKGRVIDARFSKKVVVRVRNRP